MARTYITQNHEGLVIPMICVIYGALVVFTAFVIAKNISPWREKALRKLPATFQDHTVLRRTTVALLVLVPSLLWPVILAVSIPAIAIAWLASEVQQFRTRRLLHRQTQQVADLERAMCSSRHGEHQQNGSEEGGQPGISSVPGPAMVLVTEPPPVYTPYAPAHTTRQGQWRRDTDRNAERHCFLLNDGRTPDELLKSSERANMIPSR